MNAASSAGNVLVTIPISHYCEKARWALNRAGVPFQERAHVQAFHRMATRRAGGGLTAPVLVCAAGALGDSSEILAWADTQAAPDLRLYPRDRERAAEVRALEADFDARMGPHLRRWLYEQLRAYTAGVVRELRAHPAGVHALAMFASERHATGRLP